MLRLLAGVLLVFVVLSAHAGIRIGSWNIRHLGWDNGMNYPAVARVIGRFDLVAVQEVMGPAAAERLARIIEQQTGMPWGVLTSDTIGRASYEEGYAFLWRKPDVAYVGGAALYLDPGDVYARQPYSAVFEDRETGQQFVLATVHIVYGDSIEDRLPEILALDDYWRWLAAAYPDTPRILAGDFNLAAYQAAFDPLDELANNLVVAPTTISSESGYASHYDHIWVGPSLNDVGKNGVIPIMRWLGLRNDRVRDDISDHAPVYVALGDARVVMKPFPNTGESRNSGGTEAVCIDLNQAPKQALLRLTHIGPARALDIIDGRPWPSVAALVAINGIGESALGDIRDQGLLCHTGH